MHCTFTDFAFKLEVTVNGCVHKLDVGELANRIVPADSQAKPRIKTKKVIIELAKADKGKKWKKLSAL